MLNMISVFLNVLRLILWQHIIYSEKCPMCTGKKLYSAALGWNVLYKPIKSICFSNVPFKASVFLQIFCLNNLSINVKWSVSCSVASNALQPHQAPLSMEFSRQEYWSGLSFPSRGIFPTQGLNPGLPHCNQILNRQSHQGSHTSTDVVRCESLLLLLCCCQFLPYVC